MIPSHRKPSHPGKVLAEEFLKPRGMNQIALAEKTGVSLQRINTLINGKRDMTAETAILLARLLKTTPPFWLNLQMTCDLYEATRRLKRAA
jgi:addiction module HigA family antidote